MQARAQGSFAVETTAPATGVVVGDSLVVTAAASPALPSDHRLIVYDADTSANLAVCSASTCQTTINARWSSNTDPQPRHIRSKVVRITSSSTAPNEVVAESEVLTLQIRPYRFAVSLTVGTATVKPDGRSNWPLTATSTRPASVGGYQLTLWRKEPGLSPTPVGACTGSSCSAIAYNAPPDTLVYATVKNTQGQVFGMSSQFLLAGSKATRMDANGLDAAGIATLFASARALCNELLVHRKDLQHYTTQSTVSDEWLACDAVAAQGGSATPAVAAVLAAGGAAILAVVAVIIQRSGPGSQPPSDPPPGDPPTYYPPTTVPPTLPRPAFRTDDIAATIGARNPKMQLTQTQVEAVTRNCQVRMIDAGKSAEACGLLPIFVSGRDVEEAAQHDLDSLYRASPAPAPILLSRGTPGAVHNDWYRYLAPCTDRDPNLEQDCDEYPFQSTQQGWPAFSYPAVSLRLINPTHNRRQGSALGRFYDPLHCDLGEGDEFIALPMPDSGDNVPTADRVCSPPS